MDWSQISVGAIAGSAGTWLLGILRSWFDHLLDERRQRKAEEIAVRAEQREGAKKETERQRIAADEVDRDEAVLSVYKTQLKGATELSNAASVVDGIHGFFASRPQYLKHGVNAAFLQKYPTDFRDQVHYAPQRFPPETLNRLQMNFEMLRVRPIAEENTVFLRE